MRFYDVDNGKILLDEKEIQNLDLNWLRSKIGIVLQDSMLFSDTIFNNISYGDETPLNPKKIKRIIFSAKLANAHSFISSLPLSFLFYFFKFIIFIYYYFSYFLKYFIFVIYY